MTRPRALTFDISGNIGWAFGFPDMKRPFWGSWPIGDDWGARAEFWKHKFYHFVLEQIDEHQPTVLAYESYFTDLDAFSTVHNEISISLTTCVELAAVERGIRVVKVHNSHWFKVFTGQETSRVSRAGKSQRQLEKERQSRREGRKQASKDAAVARNWYIANDDESDALGIMVYVLAQLDKAFNARHGDRGPLFRRLEMNADREAMVK